MSPLMCNVRKREEMRKQIRDALPHECTLIVLGIYIYIYIYL